MNIYQTEGGGYRIDGVGSVNPDGGLVALTGAPISGLRLLWALRDVAMNPGAARAARKRGRVYRRAARLGWVVIEGDKR